MFEVAHIALSAGESALFRVFRGSDEEEVIETVVDDSSPSDSHSAAAAGSDTTAQPKPKTKKVVKKKKRVQRSHWKLPLAVTVASGVALGLANAFYWKKPLPAK